MSDLEDNYSEYIEDFDDFDQFDSDSEDLNAVGISWKDHPTLLRDIDIITSKFGPKSIELQDVGLTDTYEVRINFNILSLVSKTTAEAWKVDINYPITILLVFSSSGYTTLSDPPKIHIYQNNIKETFGLRFQLEQIAKSFSRTICNHFHNKKDANVSLFSNPNDLQKITQKINIDYQKLFSMGFSPELIEQAKISCKSTDEIMEWCLSKNLDETYINNVNDSNNVNDFNNINDFNDPSDANYKGIFASIVKWFKSTNANKKENKLLSALKDFGSSSELKDKGIIDLNQGFLYALLIQILSRIRGLNNYCVICDREHVFGMTGMLKPTVCARPLCTFSYQQLGVAADNVEYIASSAEVVDLLIILAKITARSNRAKDVFNPYPSLIDKDNCDNLILDPEKPNVKKALEILDSFPETSEIIDVTKVGEIKSIMDKANPYSYQLLQWLITSNRSHLVKLRPDVQIKCMNTPHQFLMLTESPEKAAKFQELKEKHGTVFVFHGSRPENWHSIIRVGLRNASGTKLQINGAALGAGIYLSPDSSVSVEYSLGMYYNGGKSAVKNNNEGRFLNESIKLIAVCEVVDHDIKKSGNIWVCPDPDKVCTRFLMVYNSQMSLNVNTLKNEQIFREAISAYQFE